uniref:Transposase n=1 Tax=Dulem virus 54 TaxID=3145765 RepID=A0AAU8B4R5_9VIRU
MLYVGLDIAKKKIDVAVFIGDKVKTKVIDNNESGYRNLIIFLHKFDSEGIAICCEATNIYWEGVAYWLAEHHPDIKLSVVNPLQIAHYSKAVLARTKTDVMDAKIIADYCKRQQPPQWQPENIALRKLQALNRHIEALINMRTKEQNRYQVVHANLKDRIGLHIEYLNQEIAQAREEVENLIKQHSDLKEVADILHSIPGLGKNSINCLLPLLANAHRFKNRAQLTAFVGLSPAENQSGSSVKGRTSISKIGRSDIRKALYMPALVAYSRTKIYRPFVERQRAAGKHPKVIIVALMRKLLLIAFACVQKRHRFDEKFYKGVDA